MNDALIAKLKTFAESRVFCDDDGEDVIVDDYAGGNIDDAFYLGERQGEVMLAREILDAIGVDYTIEAE